MTPLPILYSFRRCPFAIRARLALDVSQRECELREVVLRDKPAEMLQVSAKGTVPVLIEAQGVVIEESLEIMLWALRHRDPEGWLTPDRGTLDEMLELIVLFDTGFKGDLDRYKYPTRFVDADSRDRRDRGAEKLLKLQQRLAANRFLFGSRVALADMAILPFVRQFANVSLEWFDAQPWNELQQWLRTLQHSSRFVRIMKPLSAWVPGTCGVRFPFEANESSPQSAS